MLATPFHARTAARNLANAWTSRGGFTVPSHYGVPIHEALAAHMTVAMIDISAEQDLRFTGEGAAALLSAGLGAPVHGLGAGHSEEVHWCADGGGLRGFGVLSRIAEDDFLLRSTDADVGWFAAGATRFANATVRDTTAERGLLFVTGPFAVALMVAARLEVGTLEPLRHARIDWSGLPVRIFRGGRLGGYEISCAADDATLVFDRLLRAGKLVGLRLAGETAWELLRLEAGLPFPHLDFAPAREPFADTPSPVALGFQAPRDGGNADFVLAGLELESEQPMPFAPVFSGSKEAGRTLRALYSPALKGAIALAQISPAYALPGAVLKVQQVDANGRRDIAARVVTLPFL